MKHLGQRYVQYINRCYRRSGTLWEGRFRSCLAESETYVLNCYRYIELNPVRASMVAHLKEYVWSSYHANAEGKSGLTTPHELYLRLGKDDEARRSAYQALFQDEMDMGMVNTIRDATNDGYVLGSARFLAQVEENLGRRVQRGKAGRPFKERPEME